MNTAPNTPAATSVDALGLTLTVLRSGTDCTAGGISATADRLTVVGYYAEGDTEITPMPKESQVFGASDSAPAVALYLRTIGHSRVITVAPVSKRDGRFVPSSEWAMVGGNYAASLDSRFSNLLETIFGHRFYGALPIHDRIERV